MMELANRKIINTRIDATNYQDACDRIIKWANDRRSCYVVAANVHVVMSGYWHKEYQKIINNAALVTPDGMPLVWAMRILGIKNQTRVYGPDLMLVLCERVERERMPIYLYGGTHTMLEKLQTNLTTWFPHLIIAGIYAPPFRPLTAEEEAADIARIEASGAKIVLVGLGCPKQEEWMSRQQNKLNAVTIGVGAAFSFHSGEVSQAPRWMMKMGLEWLYRLCAEPTRLWQRYLINNPVFLILLFWQLIFKEKNKMDLNKFGDVNYGKEGVGFNRSELECESMLAQADIFLKEKRIQESVELLFKILQLNPQFGKAYNHLGWIYEIEYREYTRADEYYKKAIKYKPDYSASYINYARLLSTCKRFDELKAHLDLALTIPTVSDELIYNEYGIMYEMQQNPEAAMNYYVKAAMTTFDDKKIALYQESIDRCKKKLELKKLLNDSNL